MRDLTAIEQVILQGYGFIFSLPIQYFDTDPCPCRGAHTVKKHREQLLKEEVQNGKS